MFEKVANGTTRSTQNVLFQFQRMVVEALSGGSSSAFLGLLRDRRIYLWD